MVKPLDDDENLLPLEVEEFLTGEVERRAPRGMPPHGHLLRIVVEGDDAVRVANTADALAEALANNDKAGTASAIKAIGQGPFAFLLPSIRAWLIVSQDPRAATVALDAAAGNPLGVRGPADLTRARLVTRPAGAGGLAARAARLG